MPKQSDRIRCQEVAEALPSLTDGTVATPEVTAHVDACLRCQADLAQYRRLLKALRTMRTEVLEPSPGLLTDILTSLEEAGERRAMRSLLTGRRAAYVGGIAAATAAAGAAGAIVLARRGGLRLRNAS